MLKNLPVKQCSHCSSADFALKGRGNRVRLDAHFAWDFKGRELPYFFRLFWKDF